MQQRALQLLEPCGAVSIHPARCPSLGPARPSKCPSLVVTWPLCASASGRCHQRLGGTSGNPPATAGTIGAPCIVRAYVGPNLRTVLVCKLGLVCRPVWPHAPFAHSVSVCRSNAGDRILCKLDAQLARCICKLYQFAKWVSQFADGRACSTSLQTDNPILGWMARSYTIKTYPVSLVLVL